eukprot:sb/3468502/
MAMVPLLPIYIEPVTQLAQTQSQDQMVATRRSSRLQQRVQVPEVTSSTRATVEEETTDVLESVSEQTVPDEEIEEEEEEEQEGEEEEEEETKVEEEEEGKSEEIESDKEAEDESKEEEVSENDEDDDDDDDEDDDEAPEEVSFATSKEKHQLDSSAIKSSILVGKKRRLLPASLLGKVSEFESLREAAELRSVEATPQPPDEDSDMEEERCRIKVVSLKSLPSLPPSPPPDQDQKTVVRRGGKFKKVKLGPAANFLVS